LDIGASSFHTVAAAVFVGRQQPDVFSFEAEHPATMDLVDPVMREEVAAQVEMGGEALHNQRVDVEHMWVSTEAKR
jgi:hypothetical protein